MILSLTWSRGDKISVLDALLEPLNGSVDKYRNSVIVLLIHEAKASGRAQRRASLTAFQQDRKQALDDFLAYDGESQLSFFNDAQPFNRRQNAHADSVARLHIQGPEFSPRALSGRISEVWTEVLRERGSTLRLVAHSPSWFSALGDNHREDEGRKARRESRRSVSR